jgi:hypothetical protein
LASIHTEIQQFCLLSDRIGFERHPTQPETETVFYVPFRPKVVIWSTDVYDANIFFIQVNSTYEYYTLQ